MFVIIIQTIDPIPSFRFFVRIGDSIFLDVTVFDEAIVSDSLKRCPSFSGRMRHRGYKKIVLLYTDKSTASLFPSCELTCESSTGTTERPSRKEGSTERTGGQNNDKHSR
jgi:hypothetical protein